MKFLYRYIIYTIYTIYIYSKMSNLNGGTILLNGLFDVSSRYDGQAALHALQSYYLNFQWLVILPILYIIFQFEDDIIACNSIIIIGSTKRSINYDNHYYYIYTRITCIVSISIRAVTGAVLKLLKTNRKNVSLDIEIFLYIYR